MRQKPKLFDKNSILSLDDCDFIPKDVIDFCSGQGVRTIQSLYSLLESSPSIDRLLPEGMYTRVMQQIQERYEIPNFEPPPKRVYNVLPPVGKEWELGRTVQEIEEERKRRKDL